MSLVDVLLSNKQVVLSLVMVGGILLFAFALAIGPSILETGKQIMARRKAKQAALIARKRHAQRKRAALAKARAQAQVTTSTAATPLPPGVRAVYPDAGEIPVLATAELAAETISEPAAAATDGATEAPADASEETAEGENKPGEFEPSTDLQNLLDSVFANDEQNERYEALLRDTEVVSAEALLTLTRQVAADLRARNGYRTEGQPQ